jgi:ankyrin repeat protein/DNA-binding Xre family transcriptional regulator
MGIGKNRVLLEEAIEARLKINKAKKYWYNKLQNMSSRQFEDFTAKLLNNLGYSVERTAYTQDGGKDIIAVKDGYKYYVECKRYSAKTIVGRRDIQILFAAVYEENAYGGIFFNTGKFAKKAKDLAKKFNIELLDIEKVIAMILKAFPEEFGENAPDFIKSQSKHHFIREFINAASKGDLNKIKQKIERGIDVNVKDELGWNALRSAASNGLTDTIRFLAKSGAVVNSCDQYGRDALYIAVNYGYNEAVKILIEMGANIKDYKGEELLYKASIKGHTLVVKTLINAGVNGACEDGRYTVPFTPLMYAAKHSRRETVKFLLKEVGAKKEEIELIFRHVRFGHLKIRKETLELLEREWKKIRIQESVVGINLRRVRISKGLTQKKLAEILGPPISVHRVGLWERGEKQPDINYLENICKVLEITMDELNRPITEKDFDIYSNMTISNAQRKIKRP